MFMIGTDPYTRNQALWQASETTVATCIHWFITMSVGDGGGEAEGLQVGLADGVGGSAL